MAVSQRAYPSAQRTSCCTSVLCLAKLVVTPPTVEMSACRNSNTALYTEAIGSTNHLLCHQFTTGICRADSSHEFTVAKSPALMIFAAMVNHFTVTISAMEVTSTAGSQAAIVSTFFFALYFSTRTLMVLFGHIYHALIFAEM